MLEYTGAAELLLRSTFNSCNLLRRGLRGRGRGGVKGCTNRLFSSPGSLFMISPAQQRRSKARRSGAHERGPRTPKETVTLAH